MHVKGTLHQKNAALIWTLSKTGLTPPPNFWIWIFEKLHFFGSVPKLTLQMGLYEQNLVRKNRTLISNFI